MGRQLVLPQATAATMSDLIQKTESDLHETFSLFTMFFYETFNVPLQYFGLLDTGFFLLIN